MALQRMSHAGAAVPSALASAMGVSDTTFVLTQIAGWPTGGSQPFLAVIDPGTASEEKILCASQSSGSVTVATGGRGYDNTAPIAHLAGAIAEHVFGAIEADDDNAHIYDHSRDDHPFYARTDGTRPFTGPVTMQSGLAVTGPLAETGNLTVTGDASVSATFSVAGATTLTGLTDNGLLHATGAATLDSGLTVTGNVSATGSLSASGDGTIGGNLTADTYAASGLAGSGATAGARWVGNTAAGPPTTGTYLAGDWVIDDTGVTYLCLVAGSPGTWSVPVGGLVGQVRGPAGTIDAINNTVTILTLAVLLRAGRKYAVHARHQGSIITNQPSFVNSSLTDSAGLVLGQPYFLYSLGQAAYAVGNTIGGGISAILLPTSDVTDTLTLHATGGAGAGAAIRTNPNWAELMVIRVG
jgi:hypothetical protein